MVGTNYLDEPINVVVFLKLMLIAYVRKFNESMISRKAKNLLRETNIKINTTLNKSKNNG